MKLVSAGAKILVSRVGQVLANAAVVMLVAKTLGPVGQGHYSLTVAVGMLLAALLGGGLGLAAVPPLRQRRVLPLRMFRAQLTWTGGMTFVLLLIAWLSLSPRLAPVLRDQLGWVAGLGFVAAGAATGMLLFEVYSYDLLARGCLTVGAAINGTRAVGQVLVVAVLFVTGGLTFARAVGVWALAQLVGGCAACVIVLREFRRRRPDDREIGAGAPAAADATSPGAVTSSSPEPATEEMPADLADRSASGLVLFCLRRGWLGQLSAVAYFLLLRLDQGLLVQLRDAAEVGIYSIAVYIGEMLWLLPGALTPLLVHSSAAAATDPERDRTAVRAVRLGLGLCCLAAIPLFVLAEPLVVLLAGEEFRPSADALRALLPGIVAFAPGAVLAGDFIGRGKPHWNTQASFLTVVINVAAGLLLIPAHGAVGAAWASTIAYACGSGVMLLRFRQVLTGHAATS